MRLAADRPHRLAATSRSLWFATPTIATEVAPDLSRCCRSEGWLLGDEEPPCCTMASEAEVYRFIWRSSFDGSAAVRIGRQGTATILRWRYDWFRTPRPDDAALSPGDWARFLDALIAANFWVLDPADEPLQGLDGAEWFIEGRRGNVYRCVSRWNPRGEVHGPGRLFFDLARAPLSEVRLY